MDLATSAPEFTQARALDEQGLSRVVDLLDAHNLEHRVENAGGWNMAVVVDRPDGDVFVITGYGPDDYTVGHYDARRWDHDDPMGLTDPWALEAGLSALDVLLVLAGRALRPFTG